MKKEIPISEIPKATHLVPVYVVNYKIQLFGSHYYIYDFVHFDIIKNEDGSDMKIYYQDRDGRDDLINYCHKLIKEDFKKQETAFNKKKLELAMQEAKNRGSQSL